MGLSSGRMNRRTFLQTATATVGAATVGGALNACGSSSNSTAQGTVTVQYWDWLISQAPWVNNEIKLFEQANPGIKVKKTTQAAGTYPNLFALAIRDQKPPDVFEIPGTPALNDQAKRGWLLPLDKWATPAWRKQFPEGTFHEGNNLFSGKLYSAPLSGNGPTLPLYIHNGVFKNAGLVNADGSVKIPQTWDDVTHAAEAITKKSNGNVTGFGFGNSSFGLLHWWLDLFVRGAGSPAGAIGAVNGIDLRTGKYTYSTDRNYEDFINLFLEWKKKNYFAANSMSLGDEAARALFEQGKFGMTVGGIWCEGEWTTHGFTDYTLIPLVPPTATPKAYWYYNPGGAFFGIAAATKHPEESWKWFDWLYSPEAGKRWVQMGEDLSTFTANNDPSTIKFKPFAQYVAASKLVLPGPDPSVRNPQTSHVLISPFTPAIPDVMAGLYTGQITGVHSALADLDQRSQQALETAISQATQQGYKVSLSDYTFPDWDITKPYITKPR